MADKNQLERLESSILDRNGGKDWNKWRDSKAKRHSPIIDLQYCDLRGRNLSGLNLADAHLEGSTLNGCEGEDVIMHRTKASDANFSQVTFPKLQAARGHFNHVLFSGARLPEANFRDAVLTRTIFHKAKLNGAILIGADMWQTNLEQADISNCYIFNLQLGIQECREIICTALNFGEVPHHNLDDPNRPKDVQKLDIITQEELKAVVKLLRNYYSSPTLFYLEKTGKDPK